MSHCNRCGQPKQFGRVCGCTPLQAAPAPCCESHELRFVNDPCLRLGCDIVATSGPFYLNFPSSPKLPINANEFFFYHAVAGRMRILDFDGTSYRVELTDQARAGAVIAAGDCIWFDVQTADQFFTGSSVCLSGNFIAPAQNASQDVYFLNGSGIAIGSTVTIPYEGEVGTYVITGFVGSSENIYTYTLQNTGAGFTAGTIVKGGTDGTCNVPVTVVPDLSICDLPASTIVDTLTGCYLGTPRAFTPTGPQQTVVTDSQGRPTWQTTTNTNCCVILEGSLKLAGGGCLGQDIAVLRDVNLDCFEAAYNKAIAAKNVLPAMLDGIYRVIITAYNSSNRQITVLRGNTENFQTIEEFPAGTQICLGSCCDTCIDGPQSTNNYFISSPDPGQSATFAINLVDLAYFDDHIKTYLVGFDTNGVAGTVQDLDTGYHLTGLTLPQHADRLFYRQKICHEDPIGCDQKVEFNFNVEMMLSGVQAGMRVHYEFGHFVANSETLADDATPNPYSYASSKSRLAGYFDGPTSVDTTVIAGTGLGFGDKTQTKNRPYIAGEFTDRSILKHCDCLNSIVWLMLTFEALPGYSAGDQLADLSVAVRRHYTKTRYHEISYAFNDYHLEGWQV